MIRRRIAGAAVIIMLGNLTTSILGFVRQAVMFHTFGRTVQTDAFVAASTVPQMFYDLVIGAAISAALIPTFTEILESRGREALWRTVGTVLALVWLVLLCLIVLLVMAAHPLMSVILSGYRQHLSSSGLETAVSIVRILIPALFFLGTSAVLTATLYSLRRFTVPVFAASLYHVGIIAGAVLAPLTLIRDQSLSASGAGATLGSETTGLFFSPQLLWWFGSHSWIAREAHPMLIVVAIGCAALWANETKRNPFIKLALAAQATSRILLGTSVAIAFPRSPTIMAHPAWDETQAVARSR